jgi:YesN/AraC family two-component response regulator
VAKDLITKILYVEDEFITRLDVRNMLSCKFKKVFLAKNGNEGFELFISKNPDVIITDLKMPVLDGVEMIKKIREINKDVPIIVASAFDKEFTKCDDLKVFGFITKPITRFNLLIMVENALEQTNK